MTFGILGGDRRQRELAELLSGSGYESVTFAVEGMIGEGLEKVLKADVLVLPLPLSLDGGNLNCKEVSLSLREIFSEVKPNCIVLAGNVREAEVVLAEEYGVRIHDYFAREELTVSNAAITADCAMQMGREIMELKGKKVLVLGFGRIGKFLCQRLKDEGAEVWLATRRMEDRAWSKGYGYQWRNIAALAEGAEEVDLIFNTVPAPVLSGRVLEKLRCSVIDLSSKKCIEEEYPLYLSARGLPGRMEPKAAAKAIQESIYEILREMGESV